MKTCNVCNTNKPRCEFSSHRQTKDRLYPTCKLCVQARNRHHYRANSHHIKQHVAEQKTKNRSKANWLNKMERHRLKVEVIQGYGGKCACCGLTQFEFLTLDHVNGDGAQHRRQLAEQRGVVQIRHDTIYREARKSGFPDNFRILCMNCNFSFGMFGYCPHQIHP